MLFTVPARGGHLTARNTDGPFDFVSGGTAWQSLRGTARACLAFCG